MLYSATLKGIYFDIVGRFFSIYCIYKIFIVSGNGCVSVLALCSLLSHSVLLISSLRELVK